MRGFDCAHTAACLQLSRTVCGDRVGLWCAMCAAACLDPVVEAQRALPSGFSSCRQGQRVPLLKLQIWLTVRWLLSEVQVSAGQHSGHSLFPLLQRRVSLRTHLRHCCCQL